jgi:hypothetical protein
LIDAIAGFHESASHFIAFLLELEFARRAPGWLAVKPCARRHVI